MTITRLSPNKFRKSRRAPKHPITTGPGLALGQRLPKFYPIRNRLQQRHTRSHCQNQSQSRRNPKSILGRHLQRDQKRHEEAGGDGKGADDLMRPKAFKVAGSGHQLSCHLPVVHVFEDTPQLRARITGCVLLPRAALRSGRQIRRETLEDTFH